MSLRVTFDLDDDDLKHFQLIMREARSAAVGVAPEDIVAASRKLLSNIGRTNAPGFILERLRKLQLMIDMLSDLEWRLPHAEANRVLNALAYFTDPEDLIPDSIPGLGFLDDAIMIELVVRELRHEIEAYRDFCDYRDRMRSKLGQQTGASRKDWLQSRRDELQSRMHRRRKRGERSAAGEPRLGLFE